MIRRRKEAVTAIIVVGIIAIIIILACALWDVVHAAKVGGEWVPLGPFNGGINTSSNRGQLSPGQVLGSSNFVWGLNSRPTASGGAPTTGLLEVREGFYRFGEPVSGHGVTFIDIFKSPTGTAYLMYSDGVDLWYRIGLTGMSNALNFGRANSGTVDTYTGSKSIHGNTVLSQKWRTIFGSYEGGTIRIASTDYTIDKIVLDTLIYVTAAVGSGSLAQNYNLDYAAISISTGLQMNNNYFIYSSVGKFEFSEAGEFTILDSLTGDRYNYSTVRRACGPGFPVLKFNGSSLTTNTNGKFLRIVTNPKSAGPAANPLPTGQPFYMSFPIASSTADSIKTYGSAFMPDSTTAQYFTVEDLVYDSTSMFTRRLDSLRLQIGDSAGTGCSFPTLYIKAWCDTCFFDADTNWAITGDWFFVPRYSWTDGAQNFDSAGTYWYYGQPVTSTDVFPVVGGYRGADSAIYIACKPTATARNEWTINGNNKLAGFYRMKANKAQAATVGVEWAVKHGGAVFENRSAYLDRIYWSEVDDPDSFLVSHFMIVDHGNPLNAGGNQQGNLVVYTATNRWQIIYSGGGTYGKQYLDGARGCVAHRSFLDIDGVHYGLGTDGFWETAGEAPQLISNAVSSWFTDSLDWNRLDDIAVGYDLANDNIWFSQAGSFTLVYNRGTGSWWPQSWIAGAYGYNTHVTAADSGVFLTGGVDSSSLFARGGDDDDGDSIVASVTTGFYDYGAPQLIKNVKGLRLGYETSAIMHWTCESFGQNYATGATYSIGSFTGSTVAGWSEQQMRFAQGWYRGKRLAHKLTFYDAAGLKLPYLQALVKMGVEE